VPSVIDHKILHSTPRYYFHSATMCIVLCYVYARVCMWRKYSFERFFSSTFGTSEGGRKAKNVNKRANFISFERGLKNWVRIMIHCACNPRLFNLFCTIIGVSKRWFKRDESVATRPIFSFALDDYKAEII
jgi:hypothetical protein